MIDRPLDELGRLQALRDLAILDTGAEESFDELTGLAALVCAAPIALISLIDADRQWFKSRVGTDVRETPRDIAFCAHTIRTPGALLEIPDAAADPRFSENPLVTTAPGIRFYAGAPLVDGGGHALGTLCVLDRRPRALEPAQREALLRLARMATRLLRGRAASARLGAAAGSGPRTGAEERFHVLFEYSSDAHLIFDADGIIDCNQAAVALVGCRDKREMLSLHPAVLSPERQPDGRRSSEKCVEMDRTARERGFHRFEWDQLHRDGRVMPVEVTLTPVPLDGRTVLLAVWHDLTERKRLEASERQRERRWRLALEASGDGMWDWDRARGRLYVSPRWKSLLGYTEDQVGEELDEWTRRLHPDDRAGVLAELERHLAGEVPQYVHEYRLACRDGGWKWVLDRGLVVERDADGRPQRVIGTISDLTARRRMEDTLRVEQERFRASLARFDLVASGAAMGIWETRFAGDRTWREQFDGDLPFYWSPRLFAILGYDEASFPPRWSALAALLHPDHAALGRAAFTDCLDAGVPCNVEVQLRHRAGGYLWVHATGEVERDAAGRPLRMAGSLSDITARKRNEELLAQTQVRLIDAVSAIDAGFAMFDRDDCVVISNARFLDLYGLPERCGRPGTPYREILAVLGGQDGARELDDADEERAGERLAAHLRTGRDRELRLGDRWVRISERRLADGDSVSLHTDVTALKQAAEEMRRARDLAEQATRSKAEFLATMSHEIRTPMNGVIAMTALLLETGLTPQQLEYATTAQSCGETLVALIGDILDFSKIEAGAAELERIPFDPRLVVEDALAVVAGQAHAKGLELVAVIAPRIAGRLLGDAARLRQIIFNLLSNAVKFTAQGAVVLTLDAAPPQDGAVLVTLTVRDTGIGIAPAAQARLFKPFTQADASTTRRFGGTGLGLAICQRLALLMDGDIALASEPGRGSAFTCHLRFGACVEAAPAPASPELAGRRVLVIGGHDLAREALREQLLAWDLRCDALAAWDGAGGLDRADPPDLLIIDQAVPGGGLELGAALAGHAALAAVPRLLCAPTGLRSVLTQAQAAGFCGVLAKPLRRAKLFDALLGALGLACRLEDRPAGDAPRAAAGGAAEVRAVRAVRRVLVVEDSAVNRRVAEVLLDRLGCRCDFAADGQEAVDATAAARYDVVFMDCQMPVMDGYAATRAIRARERAAGAPRVPIVALTANAMAQDRARCLAAGMDDFLTKPIRESDLAQALARVADRPAAAATAVGTAPAGGPGAFDAAYVQALRAATGAEAVGAIVTLLRDEGQRMLGALRRAAGAGDAAALVRTAHRLGGSAGTLGLARVKTLCKELEQGPPPQPGEATAQVERIAAAFDLALGALLAHPALTAP